MKINVSGGVLVALIALASIANAQNNKPLADHRQLRQERRINQGVRSGELTRHEAHELRKDEKHIRDEKRYARTGADRRQIRRDERKTSRAIYRDKHNGRMRG